MTMLLDDLKPDDYLPAVGRPARATRWSSVGFGAVAAVAWVAAGWPVGVGGWVAAFAAGTGIGIAGLLIARIAADTNRSWAAREDVDRWDAHEWPFQLFDRCEHAHERGAVDRRYQRPKDRAALADRWAKEWGERWDSVAARCWWVLPAGVAASAALVLESPATVRVLFFLPAVVALFASVTLVAFARRRASAWRAVLGAWRSRADRAARDHVGPPAKPSPELKPKPQPRVEERLPPESRGEREAPVLSVGLTMPLPIMPEQPLAAEPPTHDLPERVIPEVAVSVIAVPDGSPESETASASLEVDAGWDGTYSVTRADPNDDD